MSTRRDPMPHQLAFMRWAKHRKAAAGFLQMRLGKSMCAIRWADSRPGVDKALVVCPLSVVPTWRRELRLEGHETCEIVGSAAQKARTVDEAGPDHKWYVMNREGLLNRSLGVSHGASHWAMLPWDLVVFDESPTIRNPRARVTKAALSALSDAKYKMILSGLPNPEGPEDYVTQMLFLHGEFMGASNFWEWRAKHMMPMNPRGWQVRPASLGVLHAAVSESSFFMTRKQAGLRDEKVRSTRWVSLPPKVMAALRSAKQDLQIGDRLTNNVLAALSWQCQLAGGRYPHDESLWHNAKLRELSYLARGEFKRERLVVWARHTAELVAAAQELQACGRETLLIHGGVDPAERERRIARFSGRQGACLVAQPRCLNMGVDLSAASVSIVMSNYFDYEIRSQLEDRTVHPKKSESSLIVDIVAEGTVDEDVLTALTDKETDAKSFNSMLAGLVKRRMVQ